MQVFACFTVGFVYLSYLLIHFLLFFFDNDLHLPLCLAGLAAVVVFLDCLWLIVGGGGGGGGQLKS